MTAEFDKFADDYEALMGCCVGTLGQESNYFLYYKAQYLQRHFGAVGPEKILDFGCGVGAFSTILAETYPKAVLHGYDISTKSIKLAKKGPLTKALFTSRLEDLDEQYDLIVIANVLHHVPPTQRESVMDAIWARVAPGSQAVVFEHNPINPLTRWVVNNCIFDAGAVLLPPKETVGYFSKCGAHPRLDYIVFFPEAVSWLKIIEPAILWLPLGAQYAVCATKHGSR